MGPATCHSLGSKRDRVETEEEPQKEGKRMRGCRWDKPPAPAPTMSRVVPGVDTTSTPPSYHPAHPCTGPFPLSTSTCPSSSCSTSPCTSSARWYHGWTRLVPP